MWAIISNGAVEQVIEQPRAVVVTVEDVSVSHPAAIFTLWSDEDRAAIGIIPARYAAEPASPRDVQVGETTWVIANGEAVGTRQWASPAGTVEGIVAERVRRLALGFNFDFGGDRGVHHIGTTEADLKGWDEVSKVASAAIATGMATFPLTIVTNTGPVTVTAMEWQSVLLAAGAFRQPIWATSFVLQAMTPIPANYTDNTHWE